MSSRAVNLGLYVVTFALLATGVATIGTSRADAGWLYDAHRYAGSLLCVLLIPKFGIILRAYTRRLRNGTWNNASTWAGLLLTLLLLISTLGALVWTLNLAPFWIQVVLFITPLALHWYVALALVPFLLWHVWVRRVSLPKFSRLPRTWVASPYTRRRALQWLGIGLLGTVGLGALELGANRSAWQRRFTGSRFVAGQAGNDFPVTSSDALPTIEVAGWQIRVHGNVPRPFSLNYAELSGMAGQETSATLDCTLGWATTRQWRGVALKELLVRAGWDQQSPVTVYALTGTAVALLPQDIDEAILATHIGVEPLTPEHGFPARLVSPSRRGYQWLKWVGQIVVS